MKKRTDVYYGIYSKDGFGVYSSKNRMDVASIYTESETTGQFDSMDEALWFAQDGFDSLDAGISSEELIGEDDVRLNWFYRIPKKKKPAYGVSERQFSCYPI